MSSATFQDLSGRSANTATLRRRGLVLAAAVAATVVVVRLVSATVSPSLELNLLLPSVGEGLDAGAPVKVHGFRIGSVVSVVPADGDRQLLRLQLDPQHAAVLTADTSARFTSSNVFGSAAVELVSSGQGAPLRAHQTLRVETASPPMSVTGLLRAGQQLTEVLNSPDVDHIVEVMRTHGELIEPLTRSLFALAGVFADATRIPISRMLSTGASFVRGVTTFVPLIPQMSVLLDDTQFLAEPGGAERTNAAIIGLRNFIVNIGELIHNTNPWSIPLVDSILNLSVPIVYALGSLMPSYDRLSGLLDRTSAAFPVIDGRPRMRVDVTVNGLANVLNQLSPPAPIPLSVPAPDAVVPPGSHALPSGVLPGTPVPPPPAPIAPSGGGPR